MKASEFPLDKTDRGSTELSLGAEQLPAVYRYVESPSAEASAGADYESCMDYGQILSRHKKTLLGFALVGLAAALVISLVQTPTYRVRTSLEIQDFNANFMDIKSVDPTDSNGSYASPESYVETQAKILQSESLIERVIDKLNLDQERPATGWRAFASRVPRMFEWSKTSQVARKEELIRRAQRNLT